MIISNRKENLRSSRVVNNYTSNFWSQVLAAAVVPDLSSTESTSGLNFDRTLLQCHSSKEVVIRTYVSANKLDAIRTYGWKNSVYMVITMSMSIIDKNCTILFKVV